MDGWLLALVLKPIVGIAILAAMYFLPRYLAWLIWWMLPAGRFRDALFEGWEWGGRVGASVHKRRSQHAQVAAHTPQRLLK